jgi:hypothetical protein
MLTRGRAFGSDGRNTFEWYRTGLTRALAVGVISHVERGRLVTAFLVRDKDLVPSLGDELFVMTNRPLYSTRPSLV